MYNQEEKKAFFEPECEILTFAATDILTTSETVGDNWDMGEF